MLFEKLRRYGSMLAILVSGLMVAIMVPGRPFQILAAILTFVAIFFFAGRGTEEDEDEQRRYGPGA
ncbi:MAG: hypothetical protein R3343_01920 [Nitriliruptorales bacterium]|nr:hypothetical protein [Nitriliruptorales bacterium]